MVNGINWAKWEKERGNMVEELELTANQVVQVSKICGGWEENIYL